MIDIIKSIQEPEDKERGLYIITYLGSNCEEYTAHVNKLGKDIAELKQKFREKKYDLNLIDEFEDLVIEKVREDDSYNC